MIERSKRFIQSAKNLAAGLPARWRRAVRALADDLRAGHCDTQRPPERCLDSLLAAIGALDRAGKVVIIPGHGLCQSGARHMLLRLSEHLRKTGKIVRLAIHPAAGWFPGHMLALLGEADNLLTAVAPINQTLAASDLALIVGACDIVNPGLSQVEGPDQRMHRVLQVENATDIVVCNQDFLPGPSGARSILYENPRTIFLPGDAWQTLQTLIDSLVPPGRNGCAGG